MLVYIRDEGWFEPVELKNTLGKTNCFKHANVPEYYFIPDVPNPD